ncbi:probable serine/threonine-protein kinase abkC [Impatiens glandulifera]|uniref:probable serine/threonine-protein kinase abkC n=1 Tax=Impatiens glandulifera TaxID=253017 RepID=UPI001FB1673E|nr:probable serine/threonine-protein kinase abkC [Impatiens glandulifera]
MSRFLSVGNVRKVVHSVRVNRVALYYEEKKFSGAYVTGLTSPHYRLYSQYVSSNFRHGIFSRNFSVITPNGTIGHNAQFSWRRLLQMTPKTPKNSIPVNKIAQAVSLALSRSYMVVPGIFALASGNIALSQSSSELDPFYSRDTLYTRAESGHLFLTSVLFSAFEGVILLLRAIYLSIMFTPCVIMAPFADSFGPGFRKVWLQTFHLTLERAGPAFIKWGQWAATRPDLFPQDLCSELSKLHMKAPEHSFSYTKKTVENAFGRKLSDMFDDFEEAPVASGSIAQVHRASLRYRYQGREMKPMVVAVKVRHPGVGESIKRDFDIINLVAKCSKFVPALSWLRLDESVQQFATFMMSQVDLAREAAHLSRFIYNFRSWKDVSFPRPVYPLVHPAVLVETFELGECVSHYIDELQGHDRLKSYLAHIGTNALLKMLLVDNFIHADMHPGNILVRVAQNKPIRRSLFKSKPHLIFLDVGMTAELSKSDRVNLLEFFKAVARRDGKTAAECTLRLSKQQNCPNPEAFIMEVKNSFDFWGSAEGDIVHPAECMHQVLEQVRRHKVNIDGNVCTAMVTTLVLEGWQKKLDPDYDVMQTLQSLLLKADWATSLSYTIEAIMAP